MSQNIRLPFQPSDHGPVPHYPQAPKQEFVFRGLIIAAAIVIVLAGIKAASAIIAPMLLALFATIILLVPLRWLESKGCPRIIALVIVLGCMAIFFFGLTRVVVNSLGELSKDSPKYAKKIAREFQRVENVLETWGYRLNFGIGEKQELQGETDPTSPDNDPVVAKNKADEEAGAKSTKTVKPLPPEPPQVTPLLPVHESEAGSIAGEAGNPGDEVPLDNAELTDKSWLATFWSELHPSGDEDEDILLEDDKLMVTPTLSPHIAPSLVELNAQSVYAWFAKTVEMVRHLIERSFLVFIITLFMIFEASRFPAKIDRAFGKGPITNEHLHRIATEIRRYLFLKAFTSFLSGVAATLVYWYFNVPGFLFWGLIACFLYFIPNLGGIIASIVPGLLIFMEGGVPATLLYAVCLIAIECTLAYGIDPKILGHGLGFSTVVIILSLIIWGWLLGAIGLFLAAPLTIMVKIILQAFKETEWVAVLIGDGPRRS